MIKIYGTQICPYCLRAKRLAEQYGFKYEYIDLDEGDNMAELLERVVKFETVPQIFWDGRHIGGYEQLASEIENTSGGFGEGRL